MRSDGVCKSDLGIVLHHVLFMCSDGVCKSDLGIVLQILFYLCVQTEFVNLT